MKRLILAFLLVTATAASAQQQIPTDAWPTYNGDYTGRRFSTLTKINADNVKHLSLAWSYRLSAQGTGPIKGTPIVVNGIAYISVPDHVWAVDARTGREIWHFEWKGKGGNHIGNRGVGMYENWLFVEMPDSQLVSLDASTGKERWNVQIANTTPQTV